MARAYISGTGHHVDPVASAVGMRRHVILVAIWSAIAVQLVRAAIDDFDTDIDNYCLDSQHHKLKPGPEDALHSQCTPWKDRACCTKNTTVAAHFDKLYNFDYDHCPQKNMSKECRKHFIQDLCFYECSPNIGPWVQKVDGMKMRKERFFEVPLCATDCDSWFRACADDLTCTDNWTRNFAWKNGKNHCPAEAACRTFREIFVNASNFCERVWDHSWKYTSDDRPCMRMWFDPSKGNPNDAVARWKVQNSGAADHVSSTLLCCVLLALSYLTR